MSEFKTDINKNNNQVAGAIDTGFKSPVSLRSDLSPNTLRFDMSALFSTVFGLSTKLIHFDKSKEKEGYDFLFKDANAADLTDKSVMSVLQNPVAFWMQLKGGNYNYYHEGEVKQKSLKDFMMPYSTIADFRRAKNITKSQLSSGKGTVKEIFSIDDWQIRLRGFFLHDGSFAGSQYNVLPEGQITELLEFEELADSIDVTGKMFELLNIHKITINEINFPQLKGHPNVLPFEMLCESDEPLELVNV